MWNPKKKGRIVSITNRAFMESPCLGFLSSEASRRTEASLSPLYFSEWVLAFLRSNGQALTAVIRSQGCHSRVDVLRGLARTCNILVELKALAGLVKDCATCVARSIHPGQIERRPHNRFWFITGPHGSGSLPTPSPFCKETHKVSADHSRVL